MSNFAYDLPFQKSFDIKKRTPTQNSHIIEETDTNTPIDKQIQQLFKEGSDQKYDLPCQRTSNQYCRISRKKENRPLSIKNIYQDISRSLSKNKHIQSEIVISQMNQNNKNSQNLRAKVTSIYEKLIQENKAKKNQMKNLITTEATFKPRQLKKQIFSCCHHSLSTQNINEKRVHKKKSTSQLPQNKKMNVYAKKLDFTSNTKTKYQRILQEHFQNTNHKKSNEFLTADEIRLSNIYGKNSAILKQRQKIQPSFITHKNKKQVMQINCTMKKSESNFVLHRKSNSVSRQSYLKAQQSKTQPKQIQNQRNLKKSESQRWMSMNFHQRQQKVLSNRKQKQVKGKQKQIQKQISPCTFKPELMAKNKSQKILHPQKQSYLENYYEKLYRKF